MAKTKLIKIKDDLLPPGFYFVGHPHALRDSLKKTSESYKILQSIDEKLEKINRPSGVFLDPESGVVFFNGRAHYKSIYTVYKNDDRIASHKLGRWKKLWEIHLDYPFIIAFPAPSKDEFKTAKSPFNNATSVKKEIRHFKKEPIIARACRSKTLMVIGDLVITHES